MRRHLGILLVLAAAVLGLAACSKSDTKSPDGSGSTQLNWDQGSWNQTNWQ
jgi:hypothetical protein